ncbi:DUF4326 domain-containing protein [Sinorhizobium meliloti]|nr:DUF4326 domain-containing protein [Sinorhizobium meliloti]
MSIAALKSAISRSIFAAPETSRVGADPDIQALERTRRFVAENADELRGKNLACWCKQDAPCHADVLLQVANRPLCGEVRR